MRIAKFLYNKQQRWGIIEKETIRVLKKTPFEGIIFSREKVSLNKVRLLAPASAGKIILAGLNYKDHADELKMKIPKEPVIFLKPPTALIAHKENIIYPKGVERLDFEAELALVIKKEARNIPVNKAYDYVLGYTCLNDVTARDMQKKDIQWTRSKSFDTFCPVGPWLETEIVPSSLKIRSYLNGEIKQDSSTKNFIFSVPRLVSFISGVMRLYPGDIISTGTPFGVGPMKPGDLIEVEVGGIGRLRNKVIAQRE